MRLSAEVVVRCQRIQLTNRPAQRLSITSEV